MNSLRRAGRRAGLGHTDTHEHAKCNFRSPPVVEYKWFSPVEDACGVRCPDLRGVRFSEVSGTFNPVPWCLSASLRFSAVLRVVLQGSRLKL